MISSVMFRLTVPGSIPAFCIASFSMAIGSAGAAAAGADSAARGGVATGFWRLSEILAKGLRVARKLLISAAGFAPRLLAASGVAGLGGTAAEVFCLKLLAAFAGRLVSASKFVCRGLAPP